MNTQSEFIIIKIVKLLNIKLTKAIVKIEKNNETLTTWNLELLKNHFVTRRRRLIDGDTSKAPLASRVFLSLFMGARKQINKLSPNMDFLRDKNSNQLQKGYRRGIPGLD